MFHRPKTLEEARGHRYRSWGGNPKGDPYRADRCAAQVADGGRSPLSHQCYAQNGHGPAGLYCKQHARKFASYEPVSPLPDTTET